MYAIIKKIALVALVLQILLIPILKEMNSSKDFTFPRNVGPNIVIDQMSVSWGSVKKEIRNLKKVNDEGEVFLYVFYDDNGKVLTKIYGSDTWNISTMYDYDNDGIDEFFVRQHEAFGGENGKISAFKFRNNKYEFWRKFERKEMPIYLDFKFYGTGYWVLVYIIELILMLTIVLWLISFAIKSPERPGSESEPPPV